RDSIDCDAVLEPDAVQHGWRGNWELEKELVGQVLQLLAKIDDQLGRHVLRFGEVFEIQGRLTNGVDRGEGSSHGLGGRKRLRQARERKVEPKDYLAECAQCEDFRPPGGQGRARRCTGSNFDKK